MTTINYKTAGVDIEAGNEAVRRIKRAVEKTFSPQVLTGIGSFGAMYDLKPIMEQYKNPVLVQSIDGVGTKMIVARMMQKFDTIGIDLVSATTNDIIVLGAKPLTLLDYIATDHLKPENIEEIIKGMAAACIENGISLVGGETAEMPDTYLKGEHDLVGIITGVVEKDEAILGKNIVPGDVVLAFPSSGLHTNGYSLARKLVFDCGGYTVDSKLSELAQTLGEALLAPHINYTKPILHLLENKTAIKGMAHITGGGVLENIPRVLPANCAVELHKNKCPVLPLFNLLRSLGRLDDHEMYRTFNMGIGMVMVVAEDEVLKMRSLLKEYPGYPLYEIGRVLPGRPEVRLL
ncbi:MAG: phosphoribosylformylglycinamidine cyclo-ligase [Legionellales bacterium]